MKKLKILLLEDAEFDAALLLRVLQRSGMAFDIVVATDGDSFLSAIEHSIFDVILADNSLPQFDATMALQIIRERNLHIPVILVTGTVSEEFAVKMMREGAYDYILKDRMQRLPNAILSAIEKYSLEAERQKNIDKLIKSQALMNESERHAHLGSWEFDMVADTIIWSDENYRILDYEPGEVEACLDNFLKRVHSGEVASVMKMIEEAMNDLDVQKFECRVVNKNGTIRYLWNEIFITRDGQNKAVRLNGIALDITARKIAEESLLRSEANMRAIFDNTEVGYLLLDASLHIVSFNGSLYRFSLEHLIKPLDAGGYILDFLKPARVRVVKAVLQKAMNGEATQYEAAYPQPDGTNKRFNISCHPVMDKEQHVIGIVMSETEA